MSAQFVEYFSVYISESFTAFTAFLLAEIPFIAGRKYIICFNLRTCFARLNFFPPGLVYSFEHNVAFAFS